MSEFNADPATSDCREDKRKSERHLIAGAVQFKWQAADGCWYEGIGITQNIGKGGVFIESDSTPPVAANVTLTVTLPAQSQPQITLQLGGTGSVRHVRRQQYPTNGFGVAADFRVEMPKSTYETSGDR